MKVQLQQTLGAILLFSLSVVTAQAAMQSGTFDNGATWIGEQDTAMPRNFIKITFRGGAGLLTPQNQAAAEILALAIAEGPAGMSAAKFREKIFRLGASVSARVTSNSFSINIQALPESQLEVLKLVSEILENPKVSSKEFSRLHAQQLGKTEGYFEDMRTVIEYFSLRHFYSYAQQVMTGDSSPATIKKLNHGSFMAEYPKLINPAHLLIGFVGPSTVDQIKSQLTSVFTRQFAVKSAPVLIPATSAPLATTTKSHVLIHKEGATDNQLLFFYRQGIKRDSDEWINSLTVMNRLGGSTGKLNEILRADRGLTYGAQASFDDLLPHWQVWTFGGIEQTSGLLTGVPEVVNAFHGAPITSKAWNESRQWILNRHRKNFELSASRLEETMWFVLADLDRGAFENFESNLATTKLDSANKFRQNLQIQSPTVYMMGDRAKLFPILKSIGVDTTQVEVVTENAIP